nr:TonB-dependent siderophore receptor [Bradyrhizobium sp. dw_78]
MFAVPPQALSTAIVSFSRAANIDLVFDGAIPAGIRTQGVSGAFALRDGLNRLLAGTGFSAQVAGGRTVRLINANAANVGGPGAVPAGAIPLDTIDVQGNSAQSPFGPGVGYVATRSVTATKTDTPIVETPQSISVTTRQQMDDQQPLNVGQAVSYYNAGVVGEDNSDSKQSDQIVTRGFTSTNYVDGLATPVGTFVQPAYDPYMLERAEVLKGATAAVYGQSYPGGILALTTKRPTDDPFHEVFVQGGSYGRIESGFDTGGPLDADKHWLYRVTGVGFDSGTQVDHTNLSRLSIAPVITYKPDDSTTLTVFANYRYDPNVGFWNKRPFAGSFVPNAAGYRIPDNFFTGDLGFNKLESKQASIGYSFEHKFDNGWTVRQNLRYMHTSWLFDSVQDDSITGTTIVRDKFQDINSYDSFQVDNQDEKSFDTGSLHHKVLFGLDYQHVDFADKETDADAPSLDLLNPNYYQPLPAYTSADTYIDTRQKLDDLGIYARDQIALGGWRASLGVREDWASSSTTNLLNNDALQTQSNAATTWNAGLLYLFDNGIAPYVSYSTSFLPTIGTDASDTAFKPTTGQQYEAGIKYQPTFMNALFTAAVFDLAQQNVLTQDPNNNNNQIQTGEIRSRGFELSARAGLTEHVDLIASYAYIDAKTTKSNNGDVGFRPAAIPENSANLWATYKFTDGMLAGLKLGGGARYLGNTENTANTYTMPAVTVFDAMASYDFGAKNPSLKGLSLALNVTNLFDRQYISFCTNGCYYGLRRNVLATLKYRW